MERPYISDMKIISVASAMVISQKDLDSLLAYVDWLENQNKMDAWIFMATIAASCSRKRATSPTIHRSFLTKVLSAVKR